MASELKENTPTDKKLKSDHMSKIGGDAEPFITLSPLKSSLGSYHLDSQITYLKHSLRDLREIILIAKDVLTWEKQWHPTAIVGGSTTLFMFLWLAEPSLLTTISLLGLIITLTDYLLPSVLSTFMNNETWTVGKEKQLEDICRTIVLYKTKFSTTIHSFYLLRTTRPKIYYGLVILNLIFLAWIGNAFNNLFLTYLMVTLILLVPGLEKQGILPKYGNALSQKLYEFTANAKQMAAKNKKE